MIQRADDRSPRGPSPGWKGRPLIAPSGEALALFAVALALRLAYTWLVHGPGAVPYSDSATYDELAWNLARGQGFQVMGATALYPTAKAPLLPWVVSLLYRGTGHVYFYAILLQCVIGALVPVILRALGRSMFGLPVGRIAGWLAVVNPLLVFFSGYLLTESLFCVVMLLALFASVEWLKTPRPGRALGVGVMWGLACLTRPTAMPLPVVVALWAWAPLSLTVAASDRLRQLGLLFLGLVLTLAPWTIRNAVVLHELVPISTGGGRTLLDANNAKVWDDPVMRGNAISTAEVEPWVSKFKNHSEVEVDRMASQEAIAFGLSRWRQWPVIAWAKLARFWRPNAMTESTGRWFQRDSLPDRILRLLDPLLLWSLVVLPLAIWGLVRTLRSTRQHFQMLPLLIIAMFTLSAVVFWGALRMRVPVEPLVVLYAAAGLADVTRRVRLRRAGMALISTRRG
jgi:4-amino-4-deoxy-L-arabinose transferase-like glycosyltransferase